MSAIPVPEALTVNGTILHGTRPTQVLDAIRARAAGGRNPADGRRLALVLEGGGMRGASPAGGALALGHMGLAETFDDVYATSAAVMNASYFMSGQEDLGITVYFDDLTGDRFCRRSRFWKILDVDYVMNEIVSRIKPLDMDRIMRSPTRLHVSVMDRSNGEGFTISVGECGVPPLKALHAALSMPVFYNRSVEIKGRRCVDGGLQIPFPLKQAIEDGCTDILVLLSRPSDYIPCPPQPWQQAVYRTLFSGTSMGAFGAFRNHHLVSSEYRDLALGRTACPDTVSIATLCPQDVPYVETMTMDREHLMRSAADFGKRTLQVFGIDSSDWNLGPRQAVSWPNGND